MAQARVRYGYRKVLVLLDREGWAVGKKLVYRLYREEGLIFRHRLPRRRKAAVPQAHRPTLTSPNEAWTLDFVADQLTDSRRFRALTVVDVFTRESLAIEVGQRLRGEDVVALLNRLKVYRGVPTRLFCDNGSEFSSQLVDLWAYHNKVSIAFSRPGKPTDNAHVESFRLMRSCFGSASMRTSSSRSGTLTNGSRPGGGSIMRVGLTGRYRIGRPRNLPGPSRRITSASPSVERSSLEYCVSQEPVRHCRSPQ